MKITLNNFGPIREFTVDLDKDFHLFVGKNNVGKSYAITAVYLIVKALLVGNLPPWFWPGDEQAVWPEDIFMYIEESSSKIKNADKISSLIKNKNFGETTDIQEFIEEDTQTIFEKTFLTKITNSFDNTFLSLDSLNNCFSGNPLKIILENSVFQSTIIAQSRKFKIEKFILKDTFSLKKIKQNRSPHEGNGATTIYYCDTLSKQENYPLHYYQRTIYRTLDKMFRDISHTVAGVHYLPASRSGLYQALSAFGQIIAELSKNRSFLSKKIELPGISEPVSDYFINLSDIRVAKRSFEDKEINKIAKLIEQKILNGKVEFNPQTKQLMFLPDNTNLKLELSSTSSMVSELAPIVSYLRYVLTREGTPLRRSKRRTKKFLIMIEEPEAHLHPEVQIQLTEIFVMLTKIGVKLMITSHSNYIFNKINNLLLAEALDQKNVSSSVFKKTATGSVSIPLDVNDLGIEDDNFLDATNNLLEEKIKIIEESNNSSYNGTIEND